MGRPFFIYLFQISTSTEEPLLPDHVGGELVFGWKIKQSYNKIVNYTCKGGTTFKAICLSVCLLTGLCKCHWLELYFKKSEDRSRLNVDPIKF